MNYLQLVQRTAAQAGHRSLNIQTVVNQTGMAANFVDWVDDAWARLQLMQYWNFMRSSASFSMTAGTQTYSMTDLGITNLREWAKSKDSKARLQLVIGDAYSTIEQIDRQLFIDRYERQAATSAQPSYFCMTENYEIKFDSVPAESGTVSGYYWRTASRMVNDDDEPEMSEDWHDAIIGLALKEYAEYDESPSVMAKGRRIFAGTYERMCIDELPEFTLGRNPVAEGWR